MEKWFVLVLVLTLLVFSSEASPILTEKQAKQLLRSRRQDRPSKPGFPDEPIREYVHHLLALEHRAEEQFLEHWLNPHCKPHCDRNLVHPVPIKDAINGENQRTEASLAHRLPGSDPETTGTEKLTLPLI